MTTYYTSDLHFNHENLIKSGFRTFDSVSQVDDLIINNINRKVGVNDTLFILGDLMMSHSEQFLESALECIKCKNKFIILGNHDNLNKLMKLKEKGVICNVKPWDVKKDKAFGIELSVALFHHPVLDHRADICLHGHSHGMLENAPIDLFDVGVDCWDFEPVTLEDILSKHYGDIYNPTIGYLGAKRRGAN